MPKIFTRFSAACALFFAGFAPAVPGFAQEAEGAAPEDRFAFTQDYEPSPAIWRLSDADTTIYLMGTIHVLPEGFEWRSAELDAIIDSVDELVVETSDEDIETSMIAFSDKIANLGSAPLTISEQLPPKVRDKWQQFARQQSTSYGQLNSSPLLMAMLGFLMEGTPGDPASSIYGVETILEAEFAESDRPVRSIENFTDILQALYRQSDKQAIRDLATELQRWDGKGPLFEGLILDEEADFWEMEHMWARGEIFDEFDIGFGSGKLGARFRRILLGDRNRAWAAWLDERLDSPGEILVAVGAGHFEGHDSVLVMLEERGLRAERIH